MIQVHKDLRVTQDLKDPKVALTFTPYVGSHKKVGKNQLKTGTLTSPSNNSVMLSFTISDGGIFILRYHLTT